MRWWSQRAPRMEMGFTFSVWFGWVKGFTFTKRRTLPASPRAFTSHTGCIFKKAAGFLKKMAGFASKARHLFKITGGLFPKRLRAFQTFLFLTG